MKIAKHLKLRATLKPRNPLVAPALMRKAGKHRKSEKTKHRDEKRILSYDIQFSSLDD